MVALDQSQKAAQAAPDRDEIVRHIQLYVDSQNEPSEEKLRRFFHEDARVTCTCADGDLCLNDPMERWFADWTSEAAGYVPTILDLTQAGDVASVLLELHIDGDPDEAWVDTHSLLRLDGVWKSMNKTATHASRAAWAGTGGHAPGESPDHDDIVQVVQLYIGGFNQGDLEKCREAFHRDAMMFFTDRDGALAETPLDDECFAEWASDAPHQVAGRLLSVIQAGEVARVVLGFGTGWVDIHSLLKLDGTWKIMNKTATHASRAGWAVPVSD
ncbi:MAG: nuclear transport factor 2 family protein [Solirubrobacteraceae bacterium]